jgi:hypothetical protein
MTGGLRNHPTVCRRRDCRPWWERHGLKGWHVAGAALLAYVAALALVVWLGQAA